MQLPKHLKREKKKAKKKVKQAIAEAIQDAMRRYGAEYRHERRCSSERPKRGNRRETHQPRKVHSETVEQLRSSVEALSRETAPFTWDPRGNALSAKSTGHIFHPLRMDPEVKWLLVYVMRGLDCLASSGLTGKIRDIIEQGPPEMLVGNFNKIFGQKILTTRKAARQARKDLGWPMPANS